MEEYFRIGEITSTHGLKGEVNVRPFTDDIRRFSDLKSVTVAAEGVTPGEDIITSREEGASRAGENEAVRSFGPNGEGRIEDCVSVPRKDGGGRPRSGVFFVEHVKYFKGTVILKLRGVDDVDEAQRYRRFSLWVDRDHALPLDEDEYYAADLIGMKVFTDGGEFFGTVSDVIRTGANDVYAINAGADKDEVLLPAIKSCVLDVDVKGGRMTVSIPKGLI